MKTSTNIFDGFSPETLQTYFETDFAGLEQADENELSYIEQCHFGDLLIEESEPTEKERFKLWRKLDENGGGILVEYCGAANRYIWQTIFEN